MGLKLEVKGTPFAPQAKIFDHIRTLPAEVWTPDRGAEWIFLKWNATDTVVRVS